MRFLVFQTRIETRVLLTEAESFDAVRVNDCTKVTIVTEAIGPWTDCAVTPLFEETVKGLKHG